MEESEFSAYIKTLRENRRLTLRDVEATTGVSNGYISQMERGLRGRPSAKVLQELAKCYGVAPEDLFERAGYFTADLRSPSEEERLDHALSFIQSDPDYQFGTRMPGQMTPAVKRFVIKMYEELTGKKLLSE